ncbi:MAG: hypothetical protein ACOC9R_00600, partial [bacterium]
MRLTRHVATSIFTIVITAALFVAATPAHAACEYQGTPQTGTVECVTWADDEQPGSDEGGSEAGTTPVSHDSQSGAATSNEPVCRDGEGAVVPCTVESDNGSTCYFGSAIGAGGGAAGSAAYLCEPPPDADEGEPEDSNGEPAPAVDPVVVAWRATTSMGLHAIDMQIAPTPVSDDPDSMGLVGLPVWLWADDTPGTWGPQSASASDGPVSVTVTARVDRVEWDMGDGTTVTCTEPGTPFDPERHTAEDESPDCGHTYLHTSDQEPDGLYTVTATSYWTAEWSDGTGQTGTIPFELTTTEQIRIGEL